MRQGGMKPKGHNSGVYWVRANAKNKKSQHKIGEKENANEPNFLDLDGDGHIDFSEWLQFGLVAIGVTAIFITLIFYEYIL